MRLPAFAILALCACDDGKPALPDGGPAAGTLGAPCLPGNVCNPPLACVAGRCLYPDLRGPDLPPDRGTPDAPVLAPCPTAGAPCKAKDPCAIEAACGNDKLCRATKLQSCDDGLQCTVDSCKGGGVCQNLPAEGSCVVNVLAGGKIERKCVSRGEAQPGSPCMVCDDLKNKLGWTAANGTGCDDGDSCTKADMCVAGICAGTYFGEKCADGLPCTEDLCDGKGGCLGNKLRAGWCQIAGLCYKDGEPDLTGCKQCDTKLSTSDWSPAPSGCTIGGKCYKAGAQEPGGCGKCDPATSTTGWTPQPNPCIISGSCYLDGKPDPTGCGACQAAASASTWTVPGQVCLVNRKCYQPAQPAPSGCGSCDPAQAKTGWSAPAGKCRLGGACVSAGQSHASSACLACDPAKSAGAWSAAAAGTKVTVYDFESGQLPAGWTVAGTDPLVRWSVADRQSTSGSWALYYGNAADGNYKTGADPSSGTVTLPPAALAAGQKAGLAFMLFVDTEMTASYDQLEVQLGGVKVWSRTSATVPAPRVWQPVYIDLTAQAGKTVTIGFKFSTVDGSLNSTEGVYVDELTIFDDC